MPSTPEICLQDVFGAYRVAQYFGEDNVPTDIGRGDTRGKVLSTIRWR